MTITTNQFEEFNTPIVAIMMGSALYFQNSLDMAKVLKEEGLEKQLPLFMTSLREDTIVSVLGKDTLVRELRNYQGNSINHTDHNFNRKMSLTKIDKNKSLVVYTDKPKINKIPMNTETNTENDNTKTNTKNDKTMKMRTKMNHEIANERLNKIGYTLTSKYVNSNELAQIQDLKTGVVYTARVGNTLRGRNPKTVFKPVAAVAPIVVVEENETVENETVEEAVTSTVSAYDLLVSAQKLEKMIIEAKSLFSPSDILKIVRKAIK